MHPAEPKARPRVLLAGATGYLGSHVLKELLHQGYKVTAISRSEACRAELQAQGVTVVLGTFAKQQTLRQVAAGCQVVISCTGFRWKEAAGLGTADSLFKVLSDGNRLLHKEAVKAGCKQFILLSHWHSNEFKYEQLEFEAREEAIDFMIEQHRKHPPPETPHYTILEYNFTFREFEQDILRIAKAGDDADWLAVGRSALQYQVNPISAADIAKHVASTILNSSFFDRRVATGGPATYTWHQLGTACFESLGRRPVFKVVAWWVYALWWWMLGLLSMFGSPGQEQRVQAMGRQRVRYHGHALAEAFGSDDVMAHIRGYGAQVKKRQGEVVGTVSNMDGRTDKKRD